jgi:hypothetical protein
MGRSPPLAYSLAFISTSLDRVPWQTNRLLLTAHRWWVVVPKKIVYTLNVLIGTAHDPRSKTPVFKSVVVVIAVVGGERKA